MNTKIPSVQTYTFLFEKLNENKFTSTAYGEAKIIICAFCCYPNRNVYELE